MSKTGTDPNKILMGDLKPELAAKADKLSSKFAPRPRRTTEEPAVQPMAEHEEEEPSKTTTSTKSTRSRSTSKKTAEKAALDDTLVQMNIRIPSSLKRDIDKIVFEKKYAGEDVTIKSLISQWIQDSVKKEQRKNG